MCPSLFAWGKWMKMVCMYTQNGNECTREQGHFWKNEKSHQLSEEVPYNFTGWPSGNAHIVSHVRDTKLIRILIVQRTEWDGGEAPSLQEYACTVCMYSSLKSGNFENELHFFCGSGGRVTCFSIVLLTVEFTAHGRRYCAQLGRLCIDCIPGSLAICQRACGCVGLWSGAREAQGLARNGVRHAPSQKVDCWFWYVPRRPGSCFFICSKKNL